MRTHALISVHNAYTDTMDACAACGKSVLYRVAVDQKPIARLCGNDECALFLRELRMNQRGPLGRTEKGA